MSKSIPPGLRATLESIRAELERRHRTTFTLDELAAALPRLLKQADPAWAALARAFQPTKAGETAENRPQAAQSAAPTESAKKPDLSFASFVQSLPPEVLALFPHFQSHFRSPAEQTKRAANAPEPVSTSAPARASAARQSNAARPSGLEIPGLEDVLVASLVHGIAYTLQFAHGAVQVFRHRDGSSVNGKPVASYVGTIRQSDVLEQLQTLSRSSLPQGLKISVATKLGDGVPTFVTFTRTVSSEGTSFVELRALPASRAPVSLDDLGITQVDRVRKMLDAERGTGTVFFEGTGTRRTLRAASDELSDRGLNVVWVEHPFEAKASVGVNAEVIVITRPIRDVHQLVLAYQLGKDALVLVSMHPEAANPVESLAALGASPGDIAERVNGTVHQRLVPTKDGRGETLLTEAVVMDKEAVVAAFLSKMLPVRHLLIDAAEKLRQGVVSEDTLFKELKDHRELLKVFI